MGKRSVMATTPDEAAQLSPKELDRQIAVARWNLASARKATLRNLARKHLAMLERAKSERTTPQET